MSHVFPQIISPIPEGLSKLTLFLAKRQKMFSIFDRILNKSVVFLISCQTLDYINLPSITKLYDLFV